MSKSAYDYVRTVQNNEVLVCDAVKKAVKRFLADIEKSKKPEYPYYYDESDLPKKIAAIEYLQIVGQDNTPQNINLQPWQVFIIANIFCWRKKADNTFRYKNAYLQIAKKNGKTTLLLILMLLDMLSRYQGRGILMGYDGTQTDPAFEELCRLILTNPELSAKLKIAKKTKTITYRDKFSVIEVSSKTVQNKEGRLPTFVIIDEYHLYPTYDRVSILENGMMGKNNLQLIMITTAGQDLNVPAYTEYKRAKQILEGTIEDDMFFTIIFELDEIDEWTDTSKYIKANPMIGYSLDVERDFLPQLTRAKQVSHMMDIYKTKKLNMWVNASKGSISRQDWERNMRAYTKDLRGKPCAMGIDLSIINDWTAVTIVFYEDGEWIFKHMFFIPEEMIKEKLQKDSYLLNTWIAGKYVTVCKGRNINIEDIKKYVYQVASEYDLRIIGIDRSYGKELIEDLADDFIVQELPQGTRLSNPIKDYQMLITENKMYDDNPVMQWMALNAVIEYDANDEAKIVKPKRTKTGDRIDGVMTSVFAFCVYKNHVLPNLQVEEQDVSALLDAMF